MLELDKANTKDFQSVLFLILFSASFFIGTILGIASLEFFLAVPLFCVPLGFLLSLLIELKLTNISKKYKIKYKKGVYTIYTTFLFFGEWVHSSNKVEECLEVYNEKYYAIQKARKEKKEAVYKLKAEKKLNKGITFSGKIDA